MIASLSTYYPDSGANNDELNIVRVLAKAKTIAAYAYKKSVGQPFIYPRNDMSYCANFLHMMFAFPTEPYIVPKVTESALNKLLILHADHEQNCSTSTVRLVGSSQANLFASLSAGICALWGPLHGGANQAVIEMLEMIQADGCNYKKVRRVGQRQELELPPDGLWTSRLQELRSPGDDPQEGGRRGAGPDGDQGSALDIAKHLEEVALRDSYFVERKLYPNVDFYSGILYRAMGIPTNMFTVMFALGRLPGWIAHWKEQRQDVGRIGRPRQIYVGPKERSLVPRCEKR